MGLPLGSAARPLTWGRSSRESTLIQRCPCRPPYRVGSPPPFSSSSPHSGSRGLRTYTPPRPARRLFHTASRPVRPTATPSTRILGTPGQVQPAHACSSPAAQRWEAAARPRGRSSSGVISGKVEREWRGPSSVTAWGAACEAAPAIFV